LRSLFTFLRSLGGCSSPLVSVVIVSCIIIKSVSDFFFKSVNIGKVTSKNERGCLVHFVRPANAMLKDEESSRTIHLFAGDCAKFSPILIFFSPADSAINLSYLKRQTILYLVISIVK